MSRCLLHISKLDEFKQWLTAKGVPYREPRGMWQVLQVNAGRHANDWQVVYERANMKEHFTVAFPLEKLVVQFCDERNLKMGRVFN